MRPIEDRPYRRQSGTANRFPRFDALWDHRRCLMTRWMGAAVAIALGVGVMAGAQTAKGDLWETTSEMSMEGVPMRMPSNTVKVCAAKDWKEPPGGRKECKNSNMKLVDNKVTWDVQCTGPTMTGHGEILRQGADAYSGTIKFTSDQGNMTVKLTGKKVGECDNPQ
jgi:uncharacterized protein DUF3617